MNKRYDISYFFGTPDKAGYDRFSIENAPSKENFRKLFNSILFGEESAHTAKDNFAGHVMLATNDEVNTRAYTGDHTKIVDVKRLPSFIMDDVTGFTQIGADVLIDGLKLSTWELDSTGRRDTRIEHLASSTYFLYNAGKELIPKGTLGQGKYWGTEIGASDIGFWDLSSSTTDKVAVAGTATADYLNADNFQYIDNTVHVTLKLQENRIWVGKNYGTYESVEAIATATAFNKAFGFTTADIAEIGTSLLASSIVLTDSNKKLTSVAKATGFNLALGTGAGTVSEGDHTHSAFSVSANGFVPYPGTIVGKVLSDSGSWISMATSSDSMKVKASSSDAVEGYLDAKVDGTTIGVASNKLYVRDDSIGFDKLDPQILQYAEVTLTGGQVSALYSSPVTAIACPSVSGYDVAIVVDSAVIEASYVDGHYDTYTSLGLITSTALIAQFGEDVILQSTISRNLLVKAIHADNATKTQIIYNKDLLINVAIGNPISSGGANSSYIVKIWYRLLLTEEEV